MLLVQTSYETDILWNRLVKDKLISPCRKPNVSFPSRRLPDYGRVSFIKHLIIYYLFCDDFNVWAWSIDNENSELFALNIFRWISVLNNAKEAVLMKAFKETSGSETNSINASVRELTGSIIQEIRRMPGNNACCDCGAPGAYYVNLVVLICMILW